MPEMSEKSSLIMFQTPSKFLEMGLNLVPLIDASYLSLVG